jgi:hypothetical protein
MFCPVCKLEYRPGFTRCNDCDVPLVASLDDAAVHTNAPGPAQEPDAPELLWTGTDSGISGAIAEALDAANIPHHERTRDVGPLPGLSKPVYAIIIHARHRAAAQTVIENVRSQLEAPQQDTDVDDSGSPSQGSNAPTDALPEAEDADDSFAPEHDYVPEDFDPDEATSEVWSGTDADTKDMLISSLRENGIGSAVVDSEGKHRILVMPSSEKRAREIIREVVEASMPPE